KSALLRALWDLRLKGDEAAPPVSQNLWFLEVMEELDPVRKLHLNARNSRHAKSRIGGMFKVIRSAAAIDADCAALWQLVQTEFHDNQRAVLQPIHRAGQLRRGLGLARATDILWTLNHPDTWLLLTDTCQWTPAAYERWLAETSCAQLLEGKSR